MYDNDLGYLYKEYGFFNHLFVIFGGFCSKNILPPFEFQGIFSNLKNSVLFIRDIDQCCYQNGIQGIDNRTEGAISFVDHIRKDYKRATFVGNSMGGFGALLYGSLCKNVDEIILFSPQTIVNGHIEDKRSYHKIFDNALKFNYNSDYLNPVKFKFINKLNIYYGYNDSFDSNYAHYARSCLPQTKLFPVIGDHSNIIKRLKNTGFLEKILSTSYKNLDQTVLFEEDKIIKLN